jgi:PIN domain nuclease of toxin-antitoxin system
MGESAVLLDTHVWLWLMGGSDRLLETPGWAAIESAKDAGGLLISIMSVWEAGMLAATGSIRTRQDHHGWVEKAAQGPGLKLQPINMGIAVSSTRLPGDFHSDPIDRILVATARELNVPLITADSRILAYAGSGHVRAIEV